MKLIACAAVLFALNSFIAGAAHAQGETDQIRFQGVSWNAGENVPEVLPQFSSTGAFFAQTFYRTDETTRPIEIDSRVFFFRVAQTVMPLEEVGTIEQVLEILGNDTRELVRQLGTADLDVEISECTRTIGGVKRWGKAVTGIVLPGSSEGQPTMGRYECYAFEQQGKGCGVIIKIATSDEAQNAIDEANADAFLSSLTIDPVGPMDVYNATIHGTSFILPIASALSNVTQPQQGVGIADLQLQGAQARLITANLGPEEDALKQHRALVSQFTTDNRNTILNDESATVLAERQLRLATDDGYPVLIDAPIVVYDTPNGPMLHTLLSYIDTFGKYESLTVSLEDPDQAGAIVRALGIGVQRGSDTVGKGTVTRLAPDIRLTLDQSAALRPELSDGLFEVSPNYFQVTEDRIDVIHRGRSFNALGLAPNGESLMNLHNTFVTRYTEQHNARGPKTLEPLAEGTTRIEPDAALRIMRPWIRTELPCVSENATLMDDVSISSTIIEYPDTKRRLVVHNVSPKLLRGIEIGMAEAIIHGAAVLDEGERHRIGAMELTGELADSFWNAHRDSLTSTTHYTTSIGECRIRVTVYDDNPRNAALSSRLLADGNLRHRFEFFLLENEIRAFRENPNELLETTIAGHDAMMIQNLYTGKDQNSSNERLVTANIRGYGIPHGEGYTVVMFVQEKEPDDARLDALAEMFAPVSE